MPRNEPVSALRNHSALLHHPRCDIACRSSKLQSEQFVRTKIIESVIWRFHGVDPHFKINSHVAEILLALRGNLLAVFKRSSSGQLIVAERRHLMHADGGARFGTTLDATGENQWACGGAVAPFVDLGGEFLFTDQPSIASASRTEPPGD